MFFSKLRPFVVIMTKKCGDLIIIKLLFHFKIFFKKLHVHYKFVFKSTTIITTNCLYGTNGKCCLKPTLKDILLRKSLCRAILIFECRDYFVQLI